MPKYLHFGTFILGCIVLLIATTIFYFTKLENIKEKYRVDHNWEQYTTKSIFGTAYHDEDVPLKLIPDEHNRLLLQTLAFFLLVPLVGRLVVFVLLGLTLLTEYLAEQTNLFDGKRDESFIPTLQNKNVVFGLSILMPVGLLLCAICIIFSILLALFALFR